MAGNTVIPYGIMSSRSGEAVCKPANSVYLLACLRTYLPRITVGFIRVRVGIIRVGVRTSLWLFRVELRLGSGRGQMSAMVFPGGQMSGGNVLPLLRCDA